MTAKVHLCVEIKALLKAGIPTELDPVALHDF